MIDRAVIALNNLAVRLRQTRCRPGEVLVLFSRCLQRSACDADVTDDLANCRRCGQCLVTRVLELGETYGVQVAMATGGRLAARRAADASVKAIVAVACGKELRAGIFASLPKAVLARSITWPCGPCKDTTIEFREVEEAVRWFLR
ncbi:MAG TPA: DUF116 domain-containing protein [Phycisphaerae bacterium]|nr:DUF116 domain-containing protein [Phycisphaerae bacterium]